MAPTHSYFGVCFQQRKQGPQSVLFLSPAEDIQDWGGIPRKSSTFLKGFQRALEKDHVADITDFFDKESANISPTAIVVAFKPGRVTITPLDLRDSPATQSLQTIGRPVRIDVDLELYTAVSVEDLAGKVAHMLAGEWGDHEEDPQAEVVDDSEDPGTNGPVDGDEGDNEFTLGTSHLQSFLDHLRSADWIAAQKRENEPQLRALLTDLLKPAMIVDGQHRVEGAADTEQGIPFPVVGLVDADWREDVFHFVVINQRARPIKAEFLSAIISSSLSNRDIEKLKARLEQAGIDLVDTRIIDLVHADANSPFRHMIDFKISGAEGKLKYQGMLQLAKRFRKLRTHNADTKFPSFFKSIFRPSTQGKTYADKRSKWIDESWFSYFCIFWSTVRDRICTAGYESLWQPGSNLLKIVALQELQNLFLQWMFDRMDPMDKEGFQKASRTFLQNLKGRFFADRWELSSLQSQTGREYLRAALNNAIKNENYKYDDALFKGVKEA